MTEREVTQTLKNWMKRKGWQVYRAPDSYNRQIECPHCVSEGREGMLYCKECAAYVPKDIGGAFTPFKPADLAVLNDGSGRPGYWVEVKLARAKTEKGMVYRPKYVEKNQVAAMTESDGYLAVGFIQQRDGENDALIGIYMVRWSAVRKMEVVTREWLKGADGVIVARDKELKVVVPKKKQGQDVLDLLGEG